MSQDTRPLKRTRIDEDGVGSESTTASLQDLKHHGELWFDDGNLVLVAGNTAFRIYRGLIVSQSTVFSDMLVSSCASADETLYGCPTVHLSDSPEDLAHFLRVLLPGSQKRIYCRDGEVYTALSFDEVSAVIRLAHKYHVTDIQNQALLFLQDYYFPSDFDRYEECRRVANISPKYGIAAVNLARLTDTPSLLPVAFLKCYLLNDAIFDGHKREDGTVEHLRSPDDLRRCFVARTALIQRNFQVMACVFQSRPSQTCDNPQHCSRVLDARCCFLARQGTVFKFNSIINWAKLIKEAAQTSAICSECEKELQARNARERHKFWEDLPKIFGITVDGWPSNGAGN